MNTPTVLHGFYAALVLLLIMTGWWQYLWILFGGANQLLASLALLIAGFCLVAAVMMHAFWKETDPMAKMNEQTQFLKDLSVAGAALAIYALLGA